MIGGRVQGAGGGVQGAGCGARGAGRGVQGAGGVPFHPSKQQPYKIFRAFSCLFVVKKWVMGVGGRSVR
jgi:hypothetical protein